MPSNLASTVKHKNVPKVMLIEVRFDLRTHNNSK